MNPDRGWEALLTGMADVTGVEAVLAAAALLLAATVGLALYVVALRRAGRRRKARIARWHRRWRQGITHYLGGGELPREMVGALKRPEANEFMAFLAPYLMDLEGEDLARLRELMVQAGLDRRLNLALWEGPLMHRAVAAHVLGMTGDAAYMPQLRPLLFDTSDLVRVSACLALMRLKDVDSIDAAFRVAQRRPEGLRLFLLEIGAAALPDLTRRLESRSLAPWELIAVLDIIRGFRYAEAAWVVLMIATESTDLAIRRAAVKALSVLEEPLSLEYLKGALQDGDAVVRAFAAAGVGNLADEESIPALEGLLGDADFWVVRAAANALATIGPAGIAVLQARVTAPVLQLSPGVAPATAHSIAHEVLRERRALPAIDATPAAAPEAP